MAKSSHNVVIIGAGHNGLVAAYYLAKAGFAPLVLDRREIVGGAAVTEEIHPGFRCPAVAHAVGPLQPQIVKDLQLDRRGLAMIKPDVRLLALDLEGRSIRIYDDPARTASELASVSAHDATRYPEFHASMARLGHAIAPLLCMTPPDIDHLNTHDYLNLGNLGLNFRGLDKKNAYRLLRSGPMAIADLATEWFENELLQAIIAARGIFGSFAGPRSAGTSAGLLLQAATDGHATASASSVKGGIGALTQALAKAASHAGAEIRTNVDVIRVQVKDGNATAVVLASGEEIPASAVISNAVPRHTFLKLVDPIDLDPNFLLKVQNYRCIGTVAKVNLALSGLPKFPAVSSRLHIGPNIDYLERAFDAAKYGSFSPAPYMDVAIPSLDDPSLAPKGAHVMSIHVQYAPYHLKNANWESRRDEFAETVMSVLSAYAPNLRDLVVQRQVITPVDLEQTYGLTGGHIFHGEHSLGQLFAFRPILGWARYRTPIQGLYLCGAGTHPGGGITGAPGANASREIVKDLKAR